jgi:hypothetical protein
LDWLDEPAFFYLSYGHILPRYALLQNTNKKAGQQQAINFFDF